MTKCSRANIKSLCSISNIQCNLWQDVNSKWLRWLCPYRSSGDYSSSDFSLEKVLLNPCGFPHIIHVSGFSNFLRTLLYLQLRTLSFAPCSLLWSHCMASQALFLNLCGSLADTICMHLKSQPCRWHKGLLLARALAKLFSLFIVVAKWLDWWALENQSREKFSRPLLFWNLVFWYSLLKVKSFAFAVLMLKRVGSCCFLWCA